AYRCDRGGIGDRRRQRGPRGRVGHRVLPGTGNSVRAVGLWLRSSSAGFWLAAQAHPRHPDLRWGAADPRRRCAGDRAVERLRVLGARRVRQRRDVADMTVSPRAGPTRKLGNANAPQNRRVGGPSRLLALMRNTWRTLTSMGT